MKFERYFEAVRYLEGLSNLPLKYDYMVTRRKPEIYIKRMRDFLERIGNPDRGFEYIHVTGTAGKGSVSTMIQSVLTAAGLKSGLVTSPAVTSTLERVRVGGLYIEPEAFADIVDYLKPHIDDAYRDGKYGRPSYFEITLAIALLYFKKCRCSHVVLEVGMGGRYDYTNVIEKKRAAVITNIDYDHVEVIGPKLEDIAYEKSGIIKYGAPVFTTEGSPNILKIFDAECQKGGSKLIRVEKGSTYSKENENLVFAVCRELGISDGKIRKGLDSTFLPCRFETVSMRPRVILDGAHNPRKMAATLADLDRQKYRRLILVIGFSFSKDSRTMLRQIVPMADKIFITRAQSGSFKPADPKTLAKQAEKFLKSGVKSVCFLDPFMALDGALQSASPEDLVLVTGSFYLSGELRARWFPEDFILRTRKSR